MDIDSMAPDELKRRLREALAEIEYLKRALVETVAEREPKAWIVTVTPEWKVERPDL